MSAFPKNTLQQGFADGEYTVLGSKRRGDIYFFRYHYIIPSNLSRIAKALKEYFFVLDKTEDVPHLNQFRKSHFEYIETAIDVFCSLKNRIGNGSPFSVGSQGVSPIAWGAFGKTARTLIARCYFHNMQDVFSYYRSMINANSYNILAVDRNYKWNKTSDPIHALANVYNKSVNFTLSCSILFLFDLIRYGGPDANIFDSVYSNDKRKAVRSSEPWIRARQAVIPSKINYDYHLYQSKQQKQTTVKENKSFYQKVQIKDIIANDLFYGSMVFDWSEKEKDELNCDNRTIMGEPEVDIDGEISQMFMYC